MVPGLLKNIRIISCFSINSRNFRLNSILKSIMNAKTRSPSHCLFDVVDSKSSSGHCTGNIMYAHVSWSQYQCDYSTHFLLIKWSLPSEDTAIHIRYLFLSQFQPVIIRILTFNFKRRAVCRLRMLWKRTFSLTNSFFILSPSNNNIRSLIRIG